MRYLIIAIPLALALASLPLLHGCAAVAVGAAAGTGYVVGEDARPVSTIKEDRDIEVKINSRLEQKHSNAHVNVNAYNKVVLLTGEVPNEQAKADVERIAREVEVNRGIYNELRVAANSSLGTRANDSFITSKVKTRLLDSRKANPVHIVVVTESGVVYLMGIVKRQEANDATEVARTTSGVQRVVRMFEYQD